MSYKIIFFGSGEFAMPILKKLAEGEFKPLAVVTQPDKPVGRKQILTSPPIKSLSLKYDISVFQPEKIKSEEAEKWIRKIVPDLIVVAEYGQIIPRKILNIPRFGALNIHPSLLPKYRGSSPIQYTILNGDKETGVTIILMDEKMDHGSIVATADCRLPIADLLYSELAEKLAKLGGDLLIKILPSWLNGEIKPSPQNESRATYTKILNREDGKIDWQKPAKEIERQIRAFEKWPMSWCFWQYNGKDLKIKIIKGHSSEILPGVEKKCGLVYITKKNEVAVVCGDGGLIIEELQLEGKDKISSQEFLRGYPKIIGSVLI